MAESKLTKQTDNVMRSLSELARDAKASGDDHLMYAANRAWWELFEHHKAAVTKLAHASPPPP